MALTVHLIRRSEHCYAARAASGGIVAFVVRVSETARDGPGWRVNAVIPGLRGSRTVSPTPEAAARRYGFRVATEPSVVRAGGWSRE